MTASFTLLVLSSKDRGASSPSILYPKEESGSHCLLILDLKPRSAGLKFGSTITFPLFYEEWELDKADVASAWDNKGDIVIGNDVWIGYEAVIMAGVHIGDGAIVGTRAVVTKDVPPYTIVGGVPAKEIRKRFSPDMIEQMQTLRWWDWTVDKIRELLPYLQDGRLDKL